VFVVLGVPDVDVGLPAGGQGQVACGEPPEEGRGRHDSVAGMTAAARGDRFPLGLGTQVRQDVPGGEASHDLDVVGVADVGEMAGQPPFERADLLVDRGQHPAGHQQFAQVGGCSPGLQGVERVVGQLDLPAAEGTQQVGGAGAALAG
jgi:hypothetical protein